MRPDYVSIVRSTWSLAKPHALSIGFHFYERLFELDPSLRPIFPSDLTAQVGKLMQTLGVAVGAIDRLETLTPALEALGRSHVAYGVSDHHYDTVGRALLDTLASTFGSAFTADVRAAWSETYLTITNVMRRAAYAAAA